MQFILGARPLCVLECRRVLAQAVVENGASVLGLWNGSNPEVGCVTGPAGTCSVVLSNLPNSTRMASFGVTALTLSGYVYKSSANHDPDGSSNGFSVTVKR